MSLQQCTLSWQAFTTCASHAMSTEKQEVMGLLLGRWHAGQKGGSIVVVDHAMILTRTDKREDRVEVGYKQLAEASSIAEKMSEQLGEDTRVVGWYHSHPHITVLPSHVDVRTQGQYQTMDRRFIGLIFSVFNEDKHSKVGTIEVTAFQARDRSGSSAADGVDGPVTRTRGSSGPVGWERTEVALSLHGPGPSSSTTPLSDALERVVRLQDTLFGEERSGYLDALRQNNGTPARDREGSHDDGDVSIAGERRGAGPSSLLSKLFCAAVYSKSLASLTGDSAIPLTDTLRSQLRILRNQAAALERRGNDLRSQLDASELALARGDTEKSLRNPCSAGIGAFQVHEGEQDIARADALRFASRGSGLRRQRVLMKTNTLVNFRVFREYPRAALTSSLLESADSAAGSAPMWEAGSSGGGGVGGVGAFSVEVNEDREEGGGFWVVEFGNKRHKLVELKPDPAQARGLLFVTDGAEIDAVCDTQEAYRMWLGVAAAICPTVGADSAA